MLKFQQQPNTGAAFTAKDRNDISEMNAQICEAFASALGADSAIAIRLTGAVLSDGNVSAGIVYWNREVFEVLPSWGLSSNPYAILIETNPADEPRTNFVNGVPSGTTITKKLRKIQFSDSGTPLFQYNQIVENRARKVENEFSVVSALVNSLIQNFTRQGFIVMYSGGYAGRFDSEGLGINDYAGWALCNGKHGTPDLRGRFIVGQANSDPSNYGYGNTEKNNPDYFTLGNHGGAKEVTLTQAMLPSFNINLYNQSGGGSLYKNASLLGNAPQQEGSSSPFRVASNDARTDTFDFPGGNQPHENRPPYYVLAFVMKL